MEKIIYSIFVINILHLSILHHFGYQIKKDYTPNTEIHVELLPGDYKGIIKLLKEKRIAMPKIAYEGKKLIIYTPEAEKTLHNLIHIIERKKETILDINMNKPSISEVFESLVKK